MRPPDPQPAPRGTDASQAPSVPAGPLPSAAPVDGAAPRGSARWELAAVALLTILAAGIRLYRLNALSLWQDEGYTAYAAGLPLGEMVRWCAADTSPPLYYALMHFWMPFARGEFGLRLPSVFFGVAAIPLIYLCGRSAHSGRAGLIAALLLTVNAFHVCYSQEARFYALYFAAALLSVYLTLELLKRPTRLRWLGWLLATAVMLYTHCTAAVYVLALSGLAWTQRPHRRNPFWRGWLKAHAALALLFLPWSFALAQQTARVIDGWWPPRPTPLRVLQTAVTMCAGPFGTFPQSPIVGTFSARQICWLLALPFLALALWALATSRQRRPEPAAAGLLIYALAPWAFIAVFSLALQSVYITRIFLPTAGALLLAGAALAGSARGRQQAVARVLTALISVSACFSLGLYHRCYRKQEIRSALEYIFRHAQAGDAVACVTEYLQPATEYYLRGHDYPLIPRALSCSLATVTSPDEPTPAEEAAALRSLPSLWVLEIDQSRAKRTNESTRARLDTFMKLRDERSFYQIHLTRYVPRRDAPESTPVAAGTTVAESRPDLIQEVFSVGLPPVR